MRILHIGFGFTPFRAGGLIEYAEDLMAAQVAHGDTVGYFSAGRRYLWFRKPRLWRWRRKGVQVFEIINSPLVLDEFGSKNPELDVSEPFSEGALNETIASFRPDVIHIQELASLPLSLLEVCHRAGVPTVMTLQDHYSLCPTFRLYDYLGQVCLQREVGHKCVPCCAALSGMSGHILNMTWRYEIRRFLGSRVAAFVWKHKDSLRSLRHVLHRAAAKHGAGSAAPPAPREPVTGPPKSAPVAPEPKSVLPELAASAIENAARAFQTRRDAAVAHLLRVDRLIAMSHRVEEIYRTLGVETDRLQTRHITVHHLSSINFRSRVHPPAPVTFITLNGCATIDKGAQLMMDAFRGIAQSAPANSFRLLIYGWLHPAAKDLLALPGVEHRGVYSVRELDGLLEEGDVGIIPSVCEEAYGLTGVEMLAKGLPVVGNARGGIVDYVKPGVTGWLNHANTADGLATIVREIIARPEQIVALSKQIEHHRATLVKSMQTHRAETEQVYREASRPAVAVTP